MIVDNAIILTAGTSSRFAPLSYEKPKAFTVVRGENLIERQIRQLVEANIEDIYVVTGYKAEQFEYLIDKYNVKLIYNDDYLTRNNNGSIYAAKDILRNSYICSSDNYFTINPFESEVDGAYYAAVFSRGYTNEWCMEEDSDGFIKSVTIGGQDKWYMMGHTFWDEDFSNKFISILMNEYDLEETKNKLWEDIFRQHLDVLKMKIKKYDNDIIYEFDTLDELRKFDNSYYTDSRSYIIKDIAERLDVEEKDIIDAKPIKSKNYVADGFEFVCLNKKYVYLYDSKELNEMENS